MTSTNFAFYCKLTASLKYPECTLGLACTKQHLRLQALEA